MQTVADDKEPARSAWMTTTKSRISLRLSVLRLLCHLRCREYGWIAGNGPARGAKEWARKQGDRRQRQRSGHRALD